MSEIKCEGLKPGEEEIIIGMKDKMFDEEQKIVSITHMPGGLTNRNFKVEFENGTKYAFRIAGEGTAEYLNRPCEHDAVAKAQIIGTSPEFYWYDEETGSNICRFVEGDTMHEPDFNERKDVVEHAAALVRKIHTSGLKLNYVFDPFAERVGYYEYLKENNWTRFYEELEELDKVYGKIEEAFKANPYPRVSCHNDCLAANFIYDVPNNKMEIIDWEYCGMNYYFFDLAAVISENDMDPEMEEVAIRAYFGGEPIVEGTTEDEEISDNTPTQKPTHGGGSSGGGGGGAVIKPPVKEEEPQPVTPPEKPEKPMVTPKFDDVKEADWYFEYVTELAGKNIVSGVGNGKFAPNDNVTREQFLKMIIEATVIEAEEAENTFTDVADDWYKSYVLMAKNLGIVNGISDTEFGIGTNITRQDMAVMISRTIEKMGITIEENEVDAFADNSKVSDYATDAVGYMKSIGLIEGYNNEYRPLDNLTRAEAAKVICELIKLF